MAAFGDSHHARVPRIHRRPRKGQHQMKLPLQDLQIHGLLPLPLMPMTCTAKTRRRVRRSWSHIMSRHSARQDLHQVLYSAVQGLLLEVSWSCGRETHRIQFLRVSAAGPAVMRLQTHLSVDLHRELLPHPLHRSRPSSRTWMRTLPPWNQDQHRH